jgi:tetratricopeptide (TPR) repeat protein
VARPLDETLDVADRLRRLAKEKQDTELDVVAHYALGYTTLCMGRLPEARENLGHGITGYLPSQRSADIYRIAQDPGVACRAYLGMTEWLAGYPERAQGLIDESISLAEEVEDAFSLAYGLCFPGAIVAEESGGDTKELVERGLDIAKNGGFALWVAFGEIHRSFGRFLDQGSDAALDELRTRVVTVPRMGVHINTPYFMTMLARACQRLGKADEGLKILDDASQSIDARGERWWEAEVSRLRGEFLYAQSPEHVGDAQGCFEQALATARNQQARSLELRSAMSLARLWQQHDKRNDARQLLGDCYAWFTEGFDTPDLKDAKALLDTFS